ncbi:UNVERIFIED_CONTAM: hypothetical protein K2H54_029128 [Gekko kuhli]
MDMGGAGRASALVAVSDTLGSLTAAAGPGGSVAAVSGQPSAAATVSAGLACAFVAAAIGQLCRGVVTSAGRPRNSNAPSEAHESFGAGVGALVSMSRVCTGWMSALHVGQVSAFLPSRGPSAGAAAKEVGTQDPHGGRLSAAGAIDPQGP